MGSYEKISGTSNAIIALSTVIGVGWATVYYINEVFTRPIPITLLSLMVYLFSIMFYARYTNKRLRWS